MLRARFSALRALLVIFLAGLSAGCSGDSIAVPPEVVRLSVQPAELAMFVGDVWQLAVQVTGSRNTAVRYASTDASIARVDGAGQVTALRTGTTTIIVTALADTNQRISVPVRVQPQLTAEVTISPALATIGVGGTVQLVVRVGSSADTAVLFRAADTVVASVSAQGLVTGRRVGSTTVTALLRADTTVRVHAVIHVVVPGQVKLTLTPSLLNLPVGSTATLVAQVAGTPDARVLFRSSDTTVATVDAVGIVRARSAGTALVTALALADSTARAEARVHVVPAGLGAFITAVTLADGRPANPEALRDTARVGLLVYRGAADSLQVLLGEQVLPECTRVYPSPQTSSSPEMLTCAVNTAAFDTLSGTPRLRNGSHAFRARLFGGSRVLAESGTEAYTLANLDRFWGRLSFSRTARDSLGRTWGGGDLTLSAVPVLFSGRPLEGLAVQFDVRRRGDSVRVRALDTDSAGGWAFRFSAEVAPEAGGVRDAVTGAAGTRPVLATAVIGGQNVSTGFANAEALLFRLDNERPLAGTLALPAARGGWVGASTAFATLHTPGSLSLGTPPASAVPADAPYGVAGVGGVRPRFYALPAESLPDPARADTAALAAAVARGREVSSGADLEQTRANDAYALVAVVADALGNASYTALPSVFGVDLGRPLLNASAPADSVNPAERLRFSADDSLSGVIGVRLTLRRLGAGEPECVDFDAAAPGCTPRLLPSGGEFDLATLVPGYYALEAAAQDRAGNESAPFVSRTYLVDPPATGAPVVAEPLLAAPPTAGLTASYTLTAADNVDLRALTLRLLFARDAASGFALPAARDTVLGGFGPPVLTQATVRLPATWMRSLQFTSAAGAPDSARVWPLVGAQAEARDAAGNVGRAEARYAPGVVPSGDGLPAGIRSFVAAASAASVCASGGDCGGAPETVQLSATVVGPGGSFAAPFERLFFYYTDRLGALRMLGAFRSLAPADTPQGRTWTYGATLDAPALGGRLPAPGGTTTIYAVGVDSQGDALLAATAVLTVR